MGTAEIPRVRAGMVIIETIETKAGGTFPQPDEEWMTGHPQEMRDFMESMALGREPLSGAPLALDVRAVIYGAFLSAVEDRRVDLILAGTKAPE